MAVEDGNNTLPVNVGLATFAFRFSAVCCAVDTGLLASDVLSQLPSPTAVGFNVGGVYVITSPSRVRLPPVTVVDACVWNVSVSSLFSIFRVFALIAAVTLDGTAVRYVLAAAEMVKYVLMAFELVRYVLAALDCVR